MFSAIRELWNSRPSRVRRLEAMVKFLDQTDVVIRKSLDLVETLVDERGAHMLALDAMASQLIYGDDDEPYPPDAIRDWARLATNLLKKHSGDCTDECHACLTCQAERLVAVAKQFVEAARKWCVVPNPGSPEANRRGCLCPVLDNGFGDPEKREFNGWVIADTCAVHTHEHDGLLRHPLGVKDHDNYLAEKQGGKR